MRVKDLIICVNPCWLVSSQISDQMFHTATYIIYKDHEP